MKNQGYLYVSKPKAVNSKYRPTLQSTDDENVKYTNLMADPRILRGNTYAAATRSNIATGPLDAAKRTEDEIETPPVKQKTLRKKGNTLFDIKSETRRRAPLDLTPYLVEEVVPKMESDASTQTDRFKPAPMPKKYIPRKTGIDASTQIEEEDNLFDFDSEVAPMLSVLVGKTMEQALMEVEEHAELEAIRKHTEKLQAERQAEEQRMRRVEIEAIAKHSQKEELKRKEIDRVDRETQVKRKVASTQFSAELMSCASEAAFSDLSRQGYFPDPAERAIEEDFMPWLYEQADRNFADCSTAFSLVQELLHNAVKIQEDARMKAEEDALALAESAKAAEPEADDEGFLKIFIQGIEGFEGPGGPIPVSAKDTIEEVEKKIQAFIASQVAGFQPPEGGLLKLAYDGTALDPSTTMLDAAVPDMGNIDVLVENE